MSFRAHNLNDHELARHLRKVVFTNFIFMQTPRGPQSGCIALPHKSHNVKQSNAVHYARGIRLSCNTAYLFSNFISHETGIL